MSIQGILVVDDTEINLRLIRHLLRKTDIRIDTAISGMDAIALAKKNRYDVFFIDHMMPEMDGIETLRRIRELENCKNIPAVAITANAVSGAREMYLKAGFTDYLSKPIDGEGLEKMLERLLPKKKAEHGDELADASGIRNVDGESFSSFTDLPEWLNSVDGIDTLEGLNNCESADGYKSVLTVFYQTADKKVYEIKKAYLSKDYETYTIKVHALKSSARIIGAADLSRTAEMLETAGREGNIGLIEKETDALLKKYRNLRDALTLLDTDEEDLPEIEPGAMKEAYKTAFEIAQIMDYGMMDSFLKDLKSYKLPSEDKEKIARIERMLTELNWDGIIKIVR